ncbi:DUF1648 domain-containing protein [Halomicroarcula limicola]|uniref:DUF1648 domain-containing protein n=1 Tax=Haloarcula limicola TaxID=1429915 RepID=A0A8J7Y4Z0_9EURY|nr:DUF1648 domain-containing protein [Halomicroarcula limicola]MBV0924332.1 DUF1648 domain-containing protein [Halomicroarcula limicola]
MRLDRRTVSVSALLIALTALAGVVLYPRLPAKVAIHFSASGTPDNYVSKAVAVTLLPALMLATLCLIEVAMRADPPDDPRTGAVVTVATMALMAAVHGLVLAWNLSYPVPFDLVLLGVAVWTVAVCGYAVRREGLNLG